MRTLGLILFLAGLAAMFGYPRYHDAFTNFEIGQYEIYDKAQGFIERSIWIATEDGPVDIRFVGVVDGVELSGGLNTAFQVKAVGAEQIFLDETVRFSGPMGDTDPERTSSIEMVIDFKQLNVERGALYQFSFEELTPQEIALSSVTMIVTGIVVPMNDQVPGIGIGLIGMGLVIFISRLRRGKKRIVGGAPMGTRSKASRIGRRAEPQAPKAEAPEKPKRKWGRGE